MEILYRLLMFFVSADTISKLMARCIAKLIETASKKGGKTWNVSKNIIKQVYSWCGLFLEVYEDDELTKEEEQMIADAIKNQTKLKSIDKILIDN